MKVLIISLISFIFFVEPKWGNDFDKAKIESLENKKLILLYFSGSDWCGPCIKLKKDVLETDEFIDFATNKLVLLRADFPRMKKNQLDKVQTQKNEKLAEKYNNKGKFPLTVLLDPSGRVLKEWDGYPKDLNSNGLKLQIQAFL